MKKAFIILGIIFLILIGSIFVLAPFINNEINNAHRLLDKGIKNSSINKRLKYQIEYNQLITNEELKKDTSLLNDIRKMDQNLLMIDNKIRTTIHYINDSILVKNSKNNKEQISLYLLGNYNKQDTTCTGVIQEISELIIKQENHILNFNKKNNLDTFNPYIETKANYSFNTNYCNTFYYLNKMSVISSLQMYNIDQYEVVLNQLNFIKQNLK